MDEDIQAGVRREVHEETGATIEIGNLTGVYKNMPAGIVALVFRCTLTSEPSLASDEASAVAWHPLTGIRELMAEAYAVRVVDAVESATTAFVRSHDGTHLLPDCAEAGMTAAASR